MMESETNSLLNVPITEAERRARQRTRSNSPSSQALLSSEQHGRDRQFTPQIGRFSSLRNPGERYDDPDQHLHSSSSNTRPSTLPEVDEESHFSDHDEEEPINRPARSVTFTRTSETAYEPVRNAPDTRAKPTPQPFEAQFWQPIWLKKISLALMVLLHLLLIVGLVVVCYNADKNNGYQVSSIVQHYYWTYIPTVVMVILLALWRQIDFHTKLLMPWKELSLGPLSPFETILVDYISEFRVLSFLAAFKRLHRPILVTSVAFLIAKGLTIAATGLFIVQTANFRDGFPTIITSAFDVAALDPSILASDNFPNSSVYTYSQKLVNDLETQLGVESGFAYLLPKLQSDSKQVPGNATFNSTVDTFVPLISCRLANVTVDGQATIETVDFPYNSTETPYGSPSNITLTINESDLCGSFPRLTFSGLDPLHYTVPERQIESRSQQVFCEDGANTDPILLLSLIEVSYSQDLLTNVTRAEGGELPIALNTQRSVSRMVNVLCQGDYTISQISVSNNTAVEGIAGISLTSIANPNNRTIEGLSATNMTTIYSSMLGSNTGLFTAAVDTNFIRSPAFDLLAFVADGQYADFFEGDKLAEIAEQTYLGTMPTFASQNLVSTISNETRRSGPVASIEWTEERLRTNWTPVIIVVTGLGIMCLLNIALIIFMPENVVPRDPNSIAAATTTLARSFELNRLLQKLQSPQNKGIAAALNGYEVGTAIATDESTGSKSFKIHVTEGQPQRNVEEIVPDLKFWNPVWAGLPMMVVTFILPLLLIAILQVIQDKSNQNQGLMDVPNDRGTLIASHWLPALVTVIVASLVNNMDFYIALFSPWAKLFKAKAPAEQSMLMNVIGHLAPSAVYHAIKARYWGAIMSGIATILAALLTVVVSGLYLVESFETAGPTRSLSRLDNFNVGLASTYSVDNDNGAGAMLNLIQHNSTFPAFTFDEYAFPKVSLIGFHGEIPPGSRIVGPIEGRLPGFRGNLSCEPPTSYGVKTVGTAVQVTASYDIPQTCRNGIDSMDSPSLSLSTDFKPATGVKEFGGRLFDLRFGTNSSEYGHVGENNSSLVADNPAVGCPSLAFIWGNFEVGNDDQRAVNVAICYQKIQSLNVNVTMQQNTTIISNTRADEQSVQNQSNPNGTTDVFDFRIQNNLARQLGTYIGQNPNVDEFFQSMINGSIQMTLTMLTSNRAIGLMGINHTYRLYMAQVINAIMREPMSNTNAALRARQQTTLQDVRTRITTSRLVQDNTSKNILHALLALSALLTLGGFVLTKMRNVLPCNPCSIAGIMSLLAGSDMCYSPDTGICECCGKVRRSFRSADGRVQVETIHADDNEHADDRGEELIRPGAEWMDDKTFARIFEGKTYSLGWWEANMKKSRAKRYGVDYGESSTGAAEGDWYLGRRKNSGTFEIFSEQVTHTEGRGRTRVLSDVDARGSYQRAGEPSPGVEAHEMRNLRSSGREGRYGNE